MPYLNNHISYASQTPTHCKNPKNKHEKAHAHVLTAKWHISKELLSVFTFALLTVIHKGKTKEWCNTASNKTPFLSLCRSPRNLDHSSHAPLLFPTQWNANPCIIISSKNNISFPSSKSSTTNNCIYYHQQTKSVHLHHTFIVFMAWQAL